MKMKNLLLLLLVGVFTISSCSKDENDESNLIGTWEGVSMYSKITLNGETLSEITLNFPSQYRPTFTFKADNTYTSFSYSYDEDENTWEAEGEYKGTYVATNGRLVLDGEADGTLNYTINGNELQLSAQETDEESGGTVDLRITLRKK